MPFKDLAPKVYTFKILRLYEKSELNVQVLLQPDPHFSTFFMQDPNPSKILIQHSTLPTEHNTQNTQFQYSF